MYKYKLLSTKFYGVTKGEQRKTIICKSIVYILSIKNGFYVIICSEVGEIVKQVYFFAAGVQLNISDSMILELLFMEVDS